MIGTKVTSQRWSRSVASTAVKTRTALLVLPTIAALAACGSSDSTSQDNDNLHNRAVVATIDAGVYDPNDPGFDDAVDVLVEICNDPGDISLMLAVETVADSIAIACPDRLN